MSRIDCHLFSTGGHGYRWEIAVPNATDETGFHYYYYYYRKGESWKGSGFLCW